MSRWQESYRQRFTINFCRSQEPNKRAVMGEEREERPDGHFLPPIMTQLPEGEQPQRTGFSRSGHRPRSCPVHASDSIRFGWIGGQRAVMFSLPPFFWCFRVLPRPSMFDRWPAVDTGCQNERIAAKFIHMRLKFSAVVTPTAINNFVWRRSVWMREIAPVEKQIVLRR